MPLKKYDKRTRKDVFIGNKAVKSLKEDTFDRFISDEDVTLVMFYDPKGASSQLTKPHFVRAAKTVNKSNAVFAAVNCIEDPMLCRAEEIRELPTIRVYSRGRLIKKQNPMVDYKEMMQALENVPEMPPKPVSRTQFTR